MTDLMRTIYDHLLDDTYTDFLPREYYVRHARLLVKREDAFTATLSDDQKELYDSYQLEAGKVHLLELEAMFQAAWKASRELA